MIEPVSPHNPQLPSTSKGLAIRGISAVIHATAKVSTNAAAVLAEAIFCRTMRRRVRDHEAGFLASATLGSLMIGKQKISTYKWGKTGNPMVLLAHGWHGHAGKFAALGNHLLSVGFRIVAFDAPGHGKSTGWRASMPEFAATLRAVADQNGPVEAIVGYSLGGSAALFAMSRGLNAKRAATIAAPADVRVWIDRFRAAFDLDTMVHARLLENLQNRLGVTWQELDLHTAASLIDAPGLIVHDTEDDDVPVSDAHELLRSWPAARLHATTGLGHRKILNDPGVIEAISEFLQNGFITTNQAAIPPSSGHNTNAGLAS